MTDGTCPSCGKNTTDRTGSDPTKVLLGIQSGQRLPAVCHACGVPTGNTQSLAVESEPQETTFAPGFASFIAHFLRPFGFINRMERYNKTVELSLVLPTCEQCARVLSEVVPRYIDFDAHRIDLLVHVEFQKAMDQDVSATRRRCSEGPTSPARGRGGGR